MYVHSMIVLSLPLQSVKRENYSQVDKVKVYIHRTMYNYIVYKCNVAVYTHALPQYIAIYLVNL